MAPEAKDPEVPSTSGIRQYQSRLKELEQSLIDRSDQDAKRMSRLMFEYSIAVVALLAAFVGALWISSWRIQPTESQRAALVSLSARADELSAELVHWKTRTAEPNAMSSVAATDLATNAVQGLENLAGHLVTLMQQPLPTQLAIAQIVPLGAVVLILGLLGLRRMQGYDQEIAGARREVSEMLRAGVNALQNQLDVRLQEAEVRTERMVTAGVRSGFQEQSAAIDGLQKQVETSREELRRDGDTLDQRINEARAALQELIDGNPWLGQSMARDWLERVKSLTSVEQAHNLAVEFRSQDQTLAARAALSAIVKSESEDGLHGGADAYHNAYIEANRDPISDKLLALKILEQGLELHRHNADLVADLVQIHQELGKPLPKDRIDALRKSDVYWSTWRLPVFEAQARAESNSEDERRTAVEILEEASRRQPRNQRIWMSYASTLFEAGEPGRACDTLREGLGHCPHSQPMHFILGQYLLESGKSAEGLVELRTALECDIHVQFQHGISQAVLVLTYAQALEANRRFGDALETYVRFIGYAIKREVIPESPQLLEFARSRIAMLKLLTGLEQEDVELAPQDRNALLRKIRESIATIDPRTALEALVALAGPEVPKDDVLAVIREITGAHDLDDELADTVRRAVDERYPDGMIE